MPRSYSEKFLLGLESQDPDKLGVRLAKLCVKSNLPVKYLTKIFGVSRMTLHSWFRGSPVRNRNADKIARFMDIVKRDLDRGDLPVATLNQAKLYINHDLIDKMSNYENDTTVL
jgi:transcriptional regulator with XRE-family HTH domain